MKKYLFAIALAACALPACSQMKMGDAGAKSEATGSAGGAKSANVNASLERCTSPFGTLAVNLSGAFLLGFLGGLALDRHAALLAGTAFVGSYTTFSTWMLETQRLGEERRIWPAVGNIAVSVALGLTAAWLGMSLGSHL